LSEGLSGLPAGGPRAGDRFPWMRLKLSPNGSAESLFDKLDDTRFTLILVGQSAPPTGTSSLGDLVRTLIIPNDPANDRELARVGIPPRAFYLLRPDGHVGLAGVEPGDAAVTRYLSERGRLK